MMQVPHAIAPDGGRSAKSATRRMWLARSLVQIAEASLFAFLLLWFRAFDPQFAENDVATIFAAVLSLSVFCTLIVGRWSDRAARPIFPIGICAGLAAGGLLVMAAAPGLPVAIAGYILFGVSGGIFLALHSSQTLRVLPPGPTRGRYLGLFNLTNTIPSLIMPWLTLALVPAFGFGTLFALLACFAAAAGILLLTIPDRANGE
jgi:MFS family permease